MYTRAVPLVVIAFGAFIAGIVVAAGPDSPGAQRFLAAWEEGDYAGDARRADAGGEGRVPARAFERAYERASDTATVSSLEVGDETEGGEVVVAPVRLETQAFGTIERNAELPLSDDGIDWAPHLAFPGLEPDERLERRTRAPQRAAILAVDRTPLAKGPAAARTLAGSTLAVVGEVGTPTPEQAKELTATGFPEGTPTGTSGLELAFNDRLAGVPGGQLIALGEAEEGEPMASESSPKAPRLPARRCERQSTRRCRRPPSRRSARCTAAQRYSMRATARFAHSPVSATRRRSRRDRRSRCSPRAARSKPASSRHRIHSRSRSPTPTSAARSQTPTTRRAAARSRRPSRTPATRCSPRSESSSGLRSWLRQRSCSASTRRRRCSASRRWPRSTRLRARSPRRSRPASRSANRRSARVRCWRRRCRWQASRRRSPMAACARRPRSCAPRGSVQTSSRSR